MPKLGIVLATYNEASNLPPLIESLEGIFYPLHPAGSSVTPPLTEGRSSPLSEELPELQIFVVDDSSPDGTSEIARRLAALHGNISVVTRPGKKGLGSALRDGLRAALEGGCDYVLTMDADLSHDPKDVPRLMALALAGEADLVQASRYVDGGGFVGFGRRRRVQSRIANMACRRLLGLPLESTNGFRVYNRRCAGLVVEEARARHYEFQPEAVLIAIRHGLRIVEIPVIFSERAEGKSKLGTAQYVRWGIFFVQALVSSTFRTGRPPKR